MSDRLRGFFSDILNNEQSRYTFAAAGAALSLLSAWIIHDQHRWRSFDTGGSPPTWYGYTRMAVLRVLRLFVGHRLSDHYPLGSDGPTYLRETIEPRVFPRPKTREWTLPQRLVDIQTTDPEVHARIFGWMERYTKANPDALELRASQAEGSSALAVYAKADLATRNSKAHDKILGNEIFHAHPEEGSLHVWLSEADLKVVVSRGWGERFPLADLGLIHPGFAFVYTPRTMAECDIVEEIIEAGIEFVTGQKPK